MSEADEGRFECEGCRKSYRWQPKLAGRKVRCKCGQVLRVPEAAPVDEEVYAGIFELAESGGPAGGSSTAAGEGGCPSCGTALAEGAVLCVQCGYNMRTGRATGGEPVVVENDAGDRAADSRLTREERMQELKDREIPIVLILFGVGLNIFWAYQRTQSDLYFGGGMGEELLILAISMVVGVALLVATCFIAAPMLDTTFGGLGSATLKLAAIYVAPAALAALIASQAGEWNWVVSFLILIGTYFGLLIWLFDLDLFEAVMFAIIGSIINRIAIFIVIVSLFSSEGPGGLS